ncbi:hypothetical protein B0J11DRAFT_406968, partial [Dendryphion nanum]
KSTHPILTSPPSTDPTNLLTIKVGQAPMTQTHTIPASFLTARSEFFQRCLNGNWPTSSTKVITLPHEDPETFATYISIARTNCLTTKGINTTFNTIETLIEAYTIAMDKLISLYTLSTFLLDPATKNIAVLQMLLWARKCANNDASTIQHPSYQHIRKLYEGTHRGCLARTLFVDIW